MVIQVQTVQPNKASSLSDPHVYVTEKRAEVMFFSERTKSLTLCLYFSEICWPSPPTWPICIAGLVIRTAPAVNRFLGHRSNSTTRVKSKLRTRSRSNHKRITQSNALPHLHILFQSLSHMLKTSLPSCGFGH